MKHRLNATSHSIGLRTARAGFLVLSAWVAGCGGGGDSGGSAPRPHGPSGSLAGRCVAPRPANAADGQGRLYNDVQGSSLDEKQFVQAWNDETYLWYQDVRGLDARVLDPNNYADPVNYFYALKSPALTASGRPKDQFHFIYDTPTWIALSQGGTSYGYGFTFSWLHNVVPRQAMVVYTDPGTPAASAGVARGAQLLAVDGVDVVNDNTRAGVDVINNGLAPSAPGTHTLSILDRGASAPRNVTLTAGSQTLVPVQNVKTLPAPNQNVGYLQFNDHIATSEQQLVAAFNQLKAAGISELVLDIRYNGGGYLDIASELAYMIAGPTRTSGKVFEQMSFNDQNPFKLTDSQRITPFLGTSQGFSVSDGQALPWLGTDGLSRVFVLAGAGTCSASEAVVNGLRGVGVDVVLIGAPTCGKPYGFYPQDNCGTTYFTIQFQGVNNQGFGDYADGFAPACSVADDYNHALGDPAEARLNVALGHLATGSCQPAFAQALSVKASGVHDVAPVRSLARENRIYR